MLSKSWTSLKTSKHQDLDTVKKSYFDERNEEKIWKELEQHTNRNIFSTLCQLINQISKIKIFAFKFNSTLRLKSQSIQDSSRRRFSKKLKSFKFKIFAINLSSIFESQFQSINLSARRRSLKVNRDQIFQIQRLYHRSQLVRHRRYYRSINQIVFLVANIMIFTYEERLITYENWFHVKSSSVVMIVADFERQLCIKDVTNCSKCLMILDDWSVDSNFLQMHLNESDCRLTQTLNDKKTSIIMISKKSYLAIKVENKYEDRLIIFT